ncbi:thioesterase family protein [Burkholderia pseudomultivorans]
MFPGDGAKPCRARVGGSISAWHGACSIRMRANTEERDPMPAKRTTVSKVMGMQAPVGHCRHDAVSGLADVLSTSALVGLMEQACVDAMRETVRDDQCSIGNVMHFTHLAPATSDAEIFVTATFRMFDGERYWFDVVAVDAAGPIASGSHARSIFERAVVELQCGKRRI